MVANPHHTLATALQQHIDRSAGSLAALKTAELWALLVMTHFEHAIRLTKPASQAEVDAALRRPGSACRLMPGSMTVAAERFQALASIPEEPGRIGLEAAWQLLRMPGKPLVSQFRVESGGPDQMPRLVHVVEASGLGDRDERELARLVSLRVRRLAWDVGMLGGVKRPGALAAAPGRVVVAGSSGLIGLQLCALLGMAGWRVDRLVRRPAGPPTLLGSEHQWDATGGDHASLARDVLDGADVVVHLGGQTLAAGRWNDRRRAQYRDSRVDSTKLLARAVAACERPPRALLVASGIHIYGDRGDEELRDDAGIGSGFLAELARDWEAAADPARVAGVRVAHLRIGMVLSARGGALAAMRPFFRLGLGCVPGTGRQWWSWVSLDDVLGQMWRVMHDDTLEGGINCVTRATRAREFCAALAAREGRGLLARVPEWALRPVLGGMEEALCASVKAVPDKLRRAGWTPRDADVADALAMELG